MKSYFVSYVVAEPLAYGSCYINADKPLSRTMTEDWRAHLSAKHGKVVILNIVLLDVVENRP